MGTAVLLLSELVSNAVRHGEGSEPIDVKITLDREDLRVIVRSRGARFDPNEALHEADGGGLRLVGRGPVGGLGGTTNPEAGSWFSESRSKPVRAAWFLCARPRGGLRAG